MADESPAVNVHFFTNEMCPYAQRVWIALNELGIAYNTTSIDLRNKPDWYTRDINPNGKVPAVRDDGAVHVESLAINEHLASRYASDEASGLLPGGPIRAQIAQWNEHLDTHLSPAFFTTLMNKGGPDADSAGKRLALAEALEYYEKNIVGPFLCGEHFTLADIAAIPFFERLALTLPHFHAHDALAPFPRTREWMATVMARPSVVATRRPPEALLKLYEMFVSRDYKFGGLNRN